MSRTGPAIPLPERVVALERGTEPFSGLPMIWAGGLLPDVPFDPTARAELLFDGTLKTWLPARPLDSPAGAAPDTPPGTAFNVQVLEEPGVRRVAIVLRTATAAVTLIDRPLEELYVRGDAGV